MPYLAVHKDPLVIISEQSIPIPMSHSLETKVEVLQWVVSRGMQACCKVMEENQFRALNGWLPKDKGAAE